MTHSIQAREDSIRLPCACLYLVPVELLAALLVCWVLGVPLACLITASRLARRAEQLSRDLDILRFELGKVKTDFERLGSRGGVVSGGEPAMGAAPAISPAQAPVTPPAPIEAPASGRATAAPAAPPVIPPLAPRPITVSARAGGQETPPAFPSAPALAGVRSTPSAPKPAPEAKPAPGLKVDWERFMGVNLFAWVGGFALFLAVAFFIKYSFENNLIPPEMRVALGFVAGIGLLVGGMVLKRKAYEATSQTLCATGTVILYAVSFACHAYYHFTGAAATFALMVLVTVTAFLLAVRLNALVVAILGLVGGFLTPPLLSTGVDNPLGLFGYVAILDAGLVAVAMKRRWYFLVVFGVVGTLLTLIGWTHEFFTVGKVWIAFAILTAFNLLFLGAFVWGEKAAHRNPWLTGSALALPCATFAYAFWLLFFRELAARPGVVFSFLLIADLPVLAMVLLNGRLGLTHLAAGAAAFLVLTAWTTGYLTHELLGWALGGYLLFAIVHAAFPVVLERVRPGAAPAWWGHLFPPAALILVLWPLLRSLEAGWLLWGTVLLVDAAAILLALVTGAVLGVVAVLVLTLLVAGVWIVQAPAELTSLPPMLLVVGGFALFFFLAGLYGGEKMLARLEAAAGGGGKVVGPETPTFLGPLGGSIEARAQIPALSAILPFLLLILMAVRLPLTDPTPVYGVAFLMLVLLLGLARAVDLPALAPVGLASVLPLEYAWHANHFTPTAAVVPILWNVGFTALFIAFPFVFRRVFAKQVLPWATAALAGPLHFFLIHDAVKQAYPNEFMGLLPAAFAIPMLAALAAVARSWASEAANRTAVLAWFGGSALFFITLIFPIQFEKQWITVGWALEGVALLWLFRRLPHPGLRGLGVALLVIAFVRLALNPAVLDYHPPSTTRIWNWYLYTYGIVTACAFAGARLLAPPRHLLWGKSVPPLLYTLGTVLAFLLLNIEIADYFSEGAALTFQFSGSFAREMTSSIGWALFALALLVVGVGKHLRAVRYAGLALLGITLLKLFLHDLLAIRALYRIGAFLGVAVISILASVLYQRFFASEPKPSGEHAGSASQ